MRDKDKEALARQLRARGWLVQFPLMRPVSASWDSASSPLSPLSCQRHVGTIDFRKRTVSVPLTELTFEEIRGIWEQIVLYSEVAG